LETYHPFVFSSPIKSRAPLGGIIHLIDVLQTYARSFFFCNPPPQSRRLETEKLPQVGDNDVLVGFLAAPINPADLNMVEGVYPIGPKAPAVGGSEGVAEVLAVGSKVKGIAVNDWVIPAKPGLGIPSLSALSVTLLTACGGRVSTG
jgi:hypothetical protein